MGRGIGWLLAAMTALMGLMVSTAMTQTTQQTEPAEPVQEQKKQQEPQDGPHRRFEDALIENLMGGWDVDRKVGSRHEKNTVQARWILNHQFLQIQMKDVKSPPQYEALVCIGYNHEKQEYVAYWMDTFGGKFSEKGVGKRDGNAIRFEFRYPEGLLRNTFTWNPDTKTWRCLIEQQDEKGAWSVFAEDVWKKAKA